MVSERGESLNLDISVVTFTREQPFTPGRKNEDALVTLEDDNKTVGFIVDGGTALSTFTSAPEVSFDGYFASNTAVSGVKKYFQTSNSSDSLLLAANNEIQNRLKNLGIDPDKTDSEFLPTCGGASLIMVNKQSGEVEISQVGDTAVLVIFKNGDVEVAIHPSINYEDIRAYELASERSAADHINIKEAFNLESVTSTLLLGRHKENLENGYGVLNGKTFAKEFIKNKTYKIDGISKIIAMSDGIFLPQRKFDQEPDWKKTAKDIMVLGPERFYEEKVFAKKESDSDLTKFPRFKKHDDASLLVITFT